MTSSTRIRFSVHTPGSESDLPTAFDTLVEQKAGALMVLSDGLFNNRSGKLAELAARHAIPTISSFHEFVVAGGLMSYGANTAALYRQVGIYTGRILNGEKPADPREESGKMLPTFPAKGMFDVRTVR
jgi:putative ABC transport system substrate-binding protein